jgi:chorismate mutase
MEEKLNNLRQQIDAIDTKIFDLLLGRVKIVEEVGALKHANYPEASIIRSGREAKMLAKIFEKSKAAGFDDKIAYGFANLWRSIICTSINIEQDCQIACHSERTFLLAREYFGIFLTPQKVKSSTMAVQKLNDGSANIVVVEAYIENRERPWWLWLNDYNSENGFSVNNFSGQGYKVFATIPFLKSEYKNIFAIAKTEPEETGRDYSLYVVKYPPENAEIISEYNGKSLLKIKGYKPQGEQGFIGSFAEVF